MQLAVPQEVPAGAFILDFIPGLSVVPPVFHTLTQQELRPSWLLPELEFSLFGLFHNATDGKPCLCANSLLGTTSLLASSRPGSLLSLGLFKLW
jgi:hypothetical protein